MEKNDDFWILHKKVYFEHFYDLPINIQEKITSDTNCEESNKLNKLVEAKIKTLLSLQWASNTNKMVGNNINV